MTYICCCIDRRQQAHRLPEREPEATGCGKSTEDDFRWHVFTEAEAWVCLELFAIDVPLLSYQCLAAVFPAEH